MPPKKPPPAKPPGPDSTAARKSIAPTSTGRKSIVPTSTARKSIVPTSTATGKPKKKLTIAEGTRGESSDTDVKSGAVPRPSVSPSTKSTTGRITASPSIVGGKSVASKSISGPTIKGLEPLGQTKHIFIRRTSDTLTEITNLTSLTYKPFEFLSTSELRMFYALDITEMPPLSGISPCLAPTTFNVKVLSSEGKEVLVIKGHLGKGSRAEINGGDEFFGYVHLDTTPSGEVFFTGLNKAGDCLFHIKEVPGTSKKEFQVTSSDGTQVLGQVGRNCWIPTQPKYPEWFTKDPIFGISFPKDQNIRTKCVTLASAMLMFYKFFRGRQ